MGEWVPRERRKGQVMGTVLSTGAHPLWRNSSRDVGHRAREGFLYPQDRGESRVQISREAWERWQSRCRSAKGACGAGGARGPGAH